MKLPFSTEQFLNIFGTYNQSVWPLQILFNLFAILCVYYVYRNSKHSGKIISAILALFWLWMGIVYHFAFFSQINKAAYVFGIIFIIQALLIIYYGPLKQKLDFAFGRNIYSYTGAVLITFALIIYPMLGYFFGHIYPMSPTFGLPCPTTIFTFGFLLFLKGKIPVQLLIIPFLWSLIGFTAALQLGIYEDTGLLISGIVTTFYAKKKNYHKNCKLNR